MLYTPFRMLSRHTHGQATRENVVGAKRPGFCRAINKPDCPGDLESHKIRLDTSLNLYTTYNILSDMSYTD